MIGELIRKLLATPFAKSKAAWNSAVVAMASLAEHLVFLTTGHVLKDISVIKSEHLKRLRDNTAAGHADAQKRLAEAREAANRVVDKNHVRAQEQLALEEKAMQIYRAKMDADKVGSEAGKIRAETALINALAAQAETRVDDLERAKARVDAALKQLNLEDGTLYVDLEALRRLIESPKQPGPPTEVPATRTGAKE